MVLLKNFFMFSPGGENEAGNLIPDNEKIEVSKHGGKEDPENKPFMEKLRDKLQEWSNDDQADTEFDDTQP